MSRRTADFRRNRLLSIATVRSYLAIIMLLLTMITSPLCGQSATEGTAQLAQEGTYQQSSSDSANHSATGAQDSGSSVVNTQAPASGAVLQTQAPRKKKHKTKRPDFNRDIFYRNKLEFSFEVGWLPINIPLIFDVFLNSPYTTWPLKYTMVPMIASLRWHVTGIDGPWILRGNTDFTFSNSFTAIPEGAETHYEAFDFGIRRNFVPRNWRVTPYYEMRGGIGDINAQGPHGVLYAQGQDLTFTYMMGAGARYNFNSKYSLAGGLTYMHVSNAFLSQPKYEDFGINVYGPIFGFNMRLGKPKIYSRSHR